MLTRPPAAKARLQHSIPFLRYPVSPHFPFFLQLSELEVRTKYSLGGGGGSILAFGAASMTSLLQAANFTVGLINSDRRENLQLIGGCAFQR